MNIVMQRKQNGERLLDGYLPVTGGNTKEAAIEAINDILFAAEDSDCDVYEVIGTAEIRYELEKEPVYA